MKILSPTLVSVMMTCISHSPAFAQSAKEWKKGYFKASPEKKVGLLNAQGGRFELSNETVNFQYSKSTFFGDRIFISVGENTATFTIPYSISERQPEQFTLTSRQSGQPMDLNVEIKKYELNPTKEYSEELKYNYYIDIVQTKHFCVTTSRYKKVMTVTILEAGSTEKLGVLKVGLGTFKKEISRVEVDSEKECVSRLEN